MRYISRTVLAHATAKTRSQTMAEAPFGRYFNLINPSG